MLIRINTHQQNLTNSKLGQVQPYLKISAKSARNFLCNKQTDKQPPASKVIRHTCAIQIRLLLLLLLLLLL